MRFQLENSKTAGGLNKKAIRSNVPIPPPPSSTYHSLLWCLRSPSPERGGISSCPRAAVKQSCSLNFSSRVHQMKYPSVYHSSLRQEKCTSNSSSSPCSPVRQMHEHSLLHLLHQGFGLLCFCKADKETNKLQEHMYWRLESLKFITSVLLLLFWIQSQILVLLQILSQGNQCLLQTKLAWR